MKVWKLSNVTMGSSVYVPEDELNFLIEELKLSGVGDEWKIEVVEMTEEIIGALPEFEGW